MSRLQIRMFLVVLLVGLCIRSSILLSDQEQLVKVLPDDAFYYMETAKHIVVGEGSTFDGINPTNGYHPLWMMLLLPIVATVSDPWLLVRLTMALGMVFNIGAAVFLYAVLRKWLNIWYVPVIGATIYYLNARSLVTSLSGLEIMVSSFFFSLSLYLSILECDRVGNSLRHKALFGLSLGLLFLARTDNAFYIMAFYSLVVWWSQPSQRVKSGAVVVGIMALVVSPWLLWNYFAFGTLFQSSGFAVPYVLQESFIANGHTTGELIINSAKLFFVFIGYRMYQSYIGFPIITYLPILAGTVYLIVRTWKVLDYAEYAYAKRLIKLLGTLTVAAVAVIFVHTFVRWYPRIYYFDQVIILSAIGFSVVLTLLRPGKILYRIRANSVSLSRFVAIAFLVIATIPAFYSGYRLFTRGEYSHQVEFLDAARWLKQNTKITDVIAGFNVGITSFFSERDVINLDGAINTAAYDAIKRQRLLDYVEESRVQYFIDYDPVMFKMYQPFLGMGSVDISRVIVKRIDRPDVDWENSSIAVYRLKRSPSHSSNE